MEERIDLKVTLLAAVLTAVVVFSGCGGSDSNEAASFLFAGTLTGREGFSGASVSADVRYSIEIEDLSARSSVILTDESGMEWQGNMTSSSSFTVTQSEGDSRFVIEVSQFTPSAAHVEATTSCVSFRCCTTLSGVVSAAGAV
jgi:hypothetical protein